MAKITLELCAANSLYLAVQRLKAGDKSLSLEDLTGELFALGESLESVCGVIEPWTEGRSNNQVMAGPGWMVSYKIASDSGNPETALINRDSAKTYVLEGDHRREFEAARHLGYEGLKAVWDRLKGEHCQVPWLYAD